MHEHLSLVLETAVGDVIFAITARVIIGGVTVVTLPDSVVLYSYMAALPMADFKSFQWDVLLVLSMK